MKKIIGILLILFSLKSYSQNSLEGINLNVSFNQVSLRWIVGGYDPGGDSAAISFDKYVKKVILDTGLAMQSRGLSLLATPGKVIPINNWPASYLIRIYSDFEASPKYVSDIINNNIETVLTGINNPAFVYHRGVIDGRNFEVLNTRLQKAKHEILDQ